MNEINLQITVDEANTILEALGNMPFVKVFGLIGKIQEQASQQLGRNGLPQDTEASESPPPTVSE